MPVTSKKNSGTKTVFTLILLGAVTFGAMAAYVKLTPTAQRAIPEIQDSSRERVTSRTGPGNADEQTSALGSRSISGQRLKSAVIDGDHVTLSTTADTVPDGVEPAVYLANQSLKAVHADGQAVSVTVKNGVASIDFTSDVQNGFGSSQEANFLQALAVTLGQLPGVDKFQITVGGQPIESLGHIDLTEPQDVVKAPKA